MSQSGGPINGPLIIAISVGVAIVFFVALFWIVRWARRKPSNALPPPRAPLYPYWTAQQAPGSIGGRRGSVFTADDEGKVAHGPRPLYGSGDAIDSSQVCLWRGPDGEYYTERDGVRLNEWDAPSLGRRRASVATPSPLVGSLTLQPSSGAMNNSRPVTPSSSPTALFLPGPSSQSSVDAVSSDPTDAARTSDGTPVPLVSQEGSAATETIAQSSSRPLSTVSHSQNGVSAHQHHANEARRQSRHSLYSISSQTPYSFDPQRRASLIRSAPHKSNMLIVIPAPLAPAVHGSNNSYSNDPVTFPPSSETDEFGRSQSKRRSRVDLWTETNNVARSRNSYTSFSEREPGRSRQRKRSHGSDRSVEPPSHFVHMEPPPPLPSPSFLSRSGTPNSASLPGSPMLGPRLPLSDEAYESPSKVNVTILNEDHDHDSNLEKEPSLVSHPPVDR